MNPVERAVAVLPTYDELENLPHIIGGILAARPDVSVLVVDGSIPDGTGALASALAIILGASLIGLSYFRMAVGHFHWAWFA